MLHSCESDTRMAPLDPLGFGTAGTPRALEAGDCHQLRSCQLCRSCQIWRIDLSARDRSARRSCAALSDVCGLYGTVRYGTVRYGTVRYGYAGSGASSCAFRWSSCGMSTELPGAAAFPLDFRRKMAKKQKEKALISGRDRYDDLFTHKPLPRNTLTKQARRVYNGGTKSESPQRYQRLGLHRLQAVRLS